MEGEVFLAEKGSVRYLLTALLAKRVETFPPVDYSAGLTSRKPQPTPSEAARALHDSNRGAR